MTAESPDTAPVVACQHCDLLQRLPRVAGRGRIRCGRCGSVLQPAHDDVLALPLALGMTGLVLFVLSNAYPLLDFGLHGQRDSSYLLAGIFELYAQGMPLLASIVLLTTFVAPLVHILLIVYIYLPLVLGRRPVGFANVLRMLQGLPPWSMLEIFLLGVVVASVKLAEQATIVPGIAAWSLALLVIVLAVVSTRVHPRQLWARIA